MTPLSSIVNNATAHLDPYLHTHEGICSEVQRKGIFTFATLYCS